MCGRRRLQLSRAEVEAQVDVRTPAAAALAGGSGGAGGRAPAAAARAGGSADAGGCSSRGRRWQSRAELESRGRVLDAGCEGEQEQSWTPAVRESRMPAAAAPASWTHTHSSTPLTHSCSFLTLMGRLKVGRILPTGLNTIFLYWRNLSSYYTYRTTNRNYSHLIGR